MENLSNLLDSGGIILILLLWQQTPTERENAMSNMNIFAMMDEEAAQQIIAMYGNDDHEANHCNADDIIIGILKQLGFDKTVEAFNHLPKWYA